MTQSLLIAGLACLAAGGVVDVTFGPARRTVRIAPPLFGMAGCALLGWAGVRATLGHPATVDLGPLWGMGRSGLLLGPLAGLFLTLCASLGVAVFACLSAWVRSGRGPGHRGVAAGSLLVLAAVAVVVTAADAFTFLFAWEALTVGFYVLTTATRQRRDQPRAAWATVGLGKVSGAALLVAFLLLAGQTGSLTLASWRAVGPGTVHDVAWLLVVVGFGVKVGLAPFQVWIPVGYPAAAGPTRAVMAGVAANVGVYGLWRFLGVLGRPPVWLVVGVLLVGGLTALGGIAFAGVQSRLTRVVAYSSIENAGLIVTAYGVALTGSVVGSPYLVAVGLLAATLQTVAHAVAKSALFVSVGVIEQAEGTDELDRLRGVGRRVPWAGATFGVGALTLAGLPPTIGFVSEWFILEALLQQFRLPGLALRLALAGAGALVALTTGLAALAFLRIVALTILSGSPSPRKPARERWEGRAGMAALAVACLALAAASPWVVRFLARGLAPLVPRRITDRALHSPWVLQPVFRNFSILSPSWLWVVMPVTFATVFVVALVLSGGRLVRWRRVPAWHSASPGATGPSDYTPFGFANPLRHVLGNVLGTRRHVVHHPGEHGSSRIEATTRIVEPVESYLYRPVRTGTLAIVGVVRRLQSGQLNAYVAYMLVALLAALAITAALR